jgi:hypothetical protein
MADINHDVRSDGVASLDEMAERPWAELPVSRVSQACRAVILTLAEYASWIEEEASEGSEVEPELAKARFDRALDQLRSEPCRSLSDAKAKCLVFRRLDSWFHEDDTRLRGFSRDLLCEITDLLDDTPTTRTHVRMMSDQMGMPGAT